ncbi:hypothetical protein SAY87_018106 [Trapa incisa]|uniref:Auxin-responsive protein n=1 Tax=Trapa incisa TaxID=236973 RepID=A0AAN7QSH1_9MYRT|nr:hypothetical protein SAY87_018106 [Trapa incisa]
MMNSLDSQQRQGSFRTMGWQSQAPHHQQISSVFLPKIIAGPSPPPPPPPTNALPPNPLGPFPQNPSFRLQSSGGGGGGGFMGLIDDQELVTGLVPPAVTVVLEGRSICHRICLHNHESYQSLARALRRIFVEGEADGGSAAADEKDLDLSNAIPGYLVAYEDMENDLLLAGDLSWKDFVRVAKRIRILPAKSRSRTMKAQVRDHN